jgi:hypothetical protein
MLTCKEVIAPFIVVRISRRFCGEFCCLTVIALVSTAGNATARTAKAAVARRGKALKKCIDEKKLESIGDDDNSQRGGLYSGTS